MTRNEGAHEYQPTIILPTFSERGLCADSELPADAWHDDATTREARYNTSQARMVCRECPIRIECLTHAIREREPSGVWGGLTLTERQRLIRERG